MFKEFGYCNSCNKLRGMVKDGRVVFYCCLHNKIVFLHDCFKGYHLYKKPEWCREGSDREKMGRRLLK